MNKLLVHHDRLNQKETQASMKSWVQRNLKKDIKLCRKTHCLTILKHLMKSFLMDMWELRVHFDPLDNVNY